MICLRTLLFASLAVPLAAAAQTPPNPNPNPNPAPTPAPAPAPKFNSGSPLDGIRNEAWSKLQEMTDAYEKCDPARFERALGELKQLRRNARAAAAAARGSAEFSNVKPEEADGLAEAIASMIEPRRYLLADLKRECARGHRPGDIGRIFGPRPDAAQQPATPQQPVTQPAPRPATSTVTPPPCPPPQPQPQTQPSPPVESILDDIEEMERWEKEQKKAARERAQTPPAQGLTQADAQAIARQQATIESFEADLAELKKLLKEGRIDEAHELVDDLDEWLDSLDRPTILGPGLTRPKLPPGLIDEWDRRIDAIIDEFRKLPQPRFRLDPASSKILDLHNGTRAGLGLAPMHWDYGLACQAISYGPTLARYDAPVHSPRTGRETSRENLLQALPGTPVDRMVGVWIAEQKYFVPGVFPNVSSTGNWADVGHFTQIAWPTTTSVGCGIQRGIGKYDWLICRYAPPGNRDGRPLFTDNGTGVIADNSGIAPPNSSTPALPFDPRDLPRLKDGGGMEQIDPPAPPPPPPPTAADAAPGGNEDNHPLVGYGAEAFIRHSAAVDCGDTTKAEAELAKLRYALDELRKRLRAARKAGAFSAVKPDDVQRQINLLESFLRAAEQRKPRNACPTPPATPASEPRSLGSRTGHQLQFSDGSQCTVQLAHEKGRKVTFDDNGIPVADPKTAASYPPPPPICPPPPPPP